jgi:hypothetical protein
MDAAIFRPGPMRASTEDSYLEWRRLIKAIPTDFQGIPREGSELPIRTRRFFGSNYWLSAPGQSHGAGGLALTARSV